jgi:hypothetical protein
VAELKISHVGAVDVKRLHGRSGGVERKGA